MVDPKKVDMNQLPKKFVDGALGAYGKEMFSFALTSGNTLEPFVTTPQVAKSISVWIGKLVKAYEEQYGIIDIKPAEIVSPIQISDLGKL